MAEIGGGELQTLISTLQHGNTQTGHLIRATAGISPVLSEVTAALRGVAQAALPGQMGAVVPAWGPLPLEPEGYITVTIPGVGPRLIAYYRGPP
jgi:hypothetical protein